MTLPSSPVQSGAGGERCAQSPHIDAPCTCPSSSADTAAGTVLGEEPVTYELVERAAVAHFAYDHGGTPLDADWAHFRENRMAYLASMRVALSVVAPSLVAAAEKRGAEKERERWQPKPGDFIEWVEPPVGSVVGDRDGDVWTRDDRGWWCSQWADGADDPARSPWLPDDSYSGEPLTDYAPLKLARWGSR